MSKQIHSLGPPDDASRKHPVPLGSKDQGKEKDAEAIAKAKLKEGTAASQKEVKLGAISVWPTISREVPPGATAASAKAVAERAHRVGSYSIMGFSIDSIVNSTLENFLNEKEYNTEDLLRDAEARLKAVVLDPQFIEFAAFLRQMIVEQLKEGAASDLVNKILSDLRRRKGINITPKMLNKLLTINTANGMVHLAEAMVRSKHHIQNYDTQSPLINLLAFLNFTARGRADLFPNPETLKWTQDAIRERDKLKKEIESFIITPASLVQKNKLQDQVRPYLIRPTAWLSQSNIDEMLDVLTDPETPDSTADIEADLTKYCPCFENYSSLSSTVKAQIRQYVIKAKAVRREEAEIAAHLTTLTNPKEKGDETAYFPNYRTLPKATQDKIDQYVRCARGARLTELFVPKIAENLVLILFPNKVSDIVPFNNIKIWGFNIQWVLNKVFDSYVIPTMNTVVSDVLGNLFLASFVDEGRQKAWRAEVQKNTGMTDVDLLVHSPAAFLKEFLRNYLQSNPEAIERITAFLDWGVPPAAHVPAEPGLAHRSLAHWVLDSLRGILNTKDPELLKSAAYLNSVVDNLTLAFIAKASALVVPAGKAIGSDEFISLLVDSLSTRLKAMNAGEFPSEKVIREFVNELPLSEQVKDFISLQIVSSTKKLAEERKQLHAIYDASVKRVSVYPIGKELIAISEQASQKLMEMGVESLKGKEKWDLSDQIDDLATEYLPGTVTDQLKKWVGENIQTFRAKFQHAFASKETMRMGIKAVILYSLSQAVEAGTAVDPSAFSIGILRRVTDAFRNAFVALSGGKEKTERFNRALEIQAQLQVAQKQHQEIKAKIGLLKRVGEAARFLTPKGKIEEKEIIRLKSALIRMDMQIPVWKEKEKANLQAVKQVIAEQVRLQKEMVEHQKSLESIESGNAKKTEILKNIDQLMQNMDSLASKEKEIAQLEERLDVELSCLQKLGGEFSALFGLDSKDKMLLPAFLKEQLWGVIEGIKNKQVLRYLFQQMAPLIQVTSDVEKRRAELEKASGTPLWGQMAAAISKELVARAPGLVGDVLKDDQAMKGVDANTLALIRTVASQVQDAAGHKEAALESIQHASELYLNGVILETFRRIVGRIGSKDLLEAIAIKVNEKLSQIRLKSVSEDILDGVLSEILGIASKEDLAGVPDSLQGLVYKQMREQLGVQLAPFIQPLLDRDADVRELTRLTNSSMGAATELCRTMAQDTIRSIPLVMTPEGIIAIVADNVPSLKSDSAMQKGLAEGLKDVLRFDDHNPSSTQLVQQYVEVIYLKAMLCAARKNHPLPPGQDIGLTLANKLIKLVGDQIPKLRKIAAGKDDAAVQKEISQITEAVTQEVIRDVFGIDSKDAFTGMPEVFKKQAYQIVTGQVSLKVSNLLTTCLMQLRTLGDDHTSTVQAKKKLAAAIGNDGASMFANEMSAKIIDATLRTMTQSVGGQLKGVTMTSESICNLMEEFARSGWGIASYLLKYGEGEPFKAMLAKGLTAAQRLPAADKAMLAQMVGNAVLQPMARVMDALSTPHAEAEAKLITQVVKVVAEHFELIKLARQQAGKREKGKEGEFTHADFVAMAKQQGGLHPAMPVARPDYHSTIDLISSKLSAPLTPSQRKSLQEAIEKLVKDDQDAVLPLRVDRVLAAMPPILGRHLSDDEKKALSAPDAQGLTLKEIIRKEADAPKLQRFEHLYKTGTEQLLKLFFPNGQDDLTFIAPELQGPVWKILQLQAPTILHLIVEVSLDRDMVTDLVIVSLETMRDSMAGPIVLEPAPAEKKEDAELDGYCGRLIFHCLDMAVLPPWIKARLIDPTTGKLNPGMERPLGNLFRKKFNGVFLQTFIKGILQPPQKKDRGEREAALTKVVEELTEASASNFIRSTWVQAQDKWDKSFESNFGVVGKEVKRALDAVFSFIFFRIIGAILELLTRPIRPWMKRRVFQLINLKENQDLFMGMLRRATADQPGSPNYAMYTENLLFKLANALQGAFKLPQ